MLATIEVDGGPHIQTRWNLTRPVTRIGSDPKSDFYLTDSSVAAHALTVEVKDRVCHVYNRTGECIQVGRQSVPANGLACWAFDSELVLTDSISLRLCKAELEPEPPSPQGGKATTPRPATETRNTDKAKAAPKFQLVVIAGCLVACCAIAIQRSRDPADRGVGPAANEARVHADSFAGLVDGSTKSGVEKALIEQLRQGEKALRRGTPNTDQMMLLHQNLRATEQVVGGLSEFESRIRAYAASKLAD